MEITTVKQRFRHGPLLLFISLALLSQVAMGVVITQSPHVGTDVGSTDIFIAETTLTGSPAVETAWVNSLLDPDVTFAIQTETVDYFLTDTADVYAFALSTAPSHFIIKNSTQVALFANVGSMDWGVFNTLSLSSAFNLPGEEFQISHVTELSGNGVNVPEPSTMALLGLGLLGMSIARRKAKKA